MKTKSIFNLKQGMGYTWRQSRDYSMWWNITDLLSGNVDDLWSTWSENDPSLKSVLREAKIFKAHMGRRMARKYGLSLEDIYKN